MRGTAPAAAGTSLPPASPLLLKMFSAYSRRYVARHFHSVRILKAAPPPTRAAGPLVVYLNHAAWWDPLVCLLLARQYFADRISHAPIDAAMLTRYSFFRRLGFFGVEPRTSQGARAFLNQSRAILESPGGLLWLTPQGRFMDVRERPLRLEGGLGLVAARQPDATFVPLAIEYAFWTEPRPEILVAFGEPITARDPRSPAEWTRTFTDALESAQDDLAERSCRREPDDWLTLNRGKTGVTTFYDGWRQLCCWLRGKSFTAEHSPRNAP